MQSQMTSTVTLDQAVEMAHNAVQRLVNTQLDSSLRVVVQEIILDDWTPILQESLTRLAEHHNHPADFLDELGASLRKEAARMRRRT
jgi:hypothetical protein